MFGWTFEVANSYSGIFRGRYITVYAGAALEPDPAGKTHGVPDGGRLRVTVDGGTNAQQFLLPGTLGLLSIKSVRGVALWVSPFAGLEIHVLGRCET
jgi:hypothetical protein